MMWIRKHKDGTIICKASNKKNLHSSYGEELGLTNEYTDVEVDGPIIIGDNINGTVQLDHRVKTNVKDSREDKIIKEMYRLAEQSLIERGELSR